MVTKSTSAKPINLALQGGGSHGAITWGVLDRLLEDRRLVIHGVSGTSAGASGSGRRSATRPGSRPYNALSGTS